MLRRSNQRRAKGNPRRIRFGSSKFLRQQVAPESKLHSHPMQSWCSKMMAALAATLWFVSFAFEQAYNIKLYQEAATSLAPNNDFAVMKYDDQEEWYPLGTTNTPYNEMTPQMDVVWARGWYNAIPPPLSTSIDYYNHAGLGGGQYHGFIEIMFPPSLCGPRWMRIDDVPLWVDLVLPKQECNFTLITGDGIIPVPEEPAEDTTARVLSLGDAGQRLLDHPKLTMWYAQNTVSSHPKLHAIPLGLPIHYGFEGSPNSAYTLETMIEIRREMPKFRERSRRVLFDVGTTDKGPRGEARKGALGILEQCPDRVEIMEPSPAVETWSKHYSTHQFGVVVRGTGWDTYRTWEYLFYGTVPILSADNPLVQTLHLPAHVPIVVVNSWEEICAWDDAHYDHLVDRYEHWIANAHHWLRPSLWVPRNQTEMDRLCDDSPGCYLHYRRHHHPSPESLQQALKTTHESMLEKLLLSATTEELEDIFKKDHQVLENVHAAERHAL